MTSHPGLYRPETEHDACGVGFVAHIRGEKSRAIVEQGLEVLRRLAHRAATGSDPRTGDGAGILLQLPHRFFKREGLRLGFDMPRRRRYGVAQVFLPAEPEARRACERLLEEVVEEEGQRVIGWREVPVDPSHLGPVAHAVLPVMRQLYIGLKRVVPSAFERKLYVIRKLAENRVRERGVDPRGRFHVASCSAETIVYKGLLLPEALDGFYPDLREPDMVSALALVHSRFSTNTFPTWDLAQPLRYVAHNGEINTVRGNRNWMVARRELLESAKFGGALDRLDPIIVPGKSDSAQFDNMLELLHLGGRSLPHAMMMMIPEAWEDNPLMDEDRRAFYEYSAALLEPWDGPAAMAFTDGHLIGATLDRNGLRPARYVITEDGRVILASEAGVLDVPPSQVKRHGRLRPGRMFLVDTEEGRLLEDEEVKGEITRRYPYRRWLAKNVSSFDDLPHVPAPKRITDERLWRVQRAFGYTDEDVRLTLLPMAESGKEPTGSMGKDSPLAVLSDRAPSLFDYFHQLFAQVTNPAIDPIRERLVMSLATGLGPDGNTFEETPDQCHRLYLPGPLLTNGRMAKLLSLRDAGVFESKRLSTLFKLDGGSDSMERALDALCDAAVEAVDEGYNVLVLSDRGVDARHAPIPALLAVSAVHQRLVRDGIRMHTGLAIETGEAREVHHFALLLGYGVSAINPYLALDTVRDLATASALRATGDEQLDLEGFDTSATRAVLDPEEAQERFIRAVNDGLLKVMSKMGISTLQSYRGAQIFEAIGLSQELIDRHFTGTPSRLGGIGLSELGREAAERHARGYRTEHSEPGELPVGGVLQWRRRGERHKWNPATVAKLQAAVREDDAKLFAEYQKLADDETRELCNLRGLLDIRYEDTRRISLEEVEPAESLFKRFVTGAMSFGSISAEAHETLAIAMNRLGGRSNSGEGGEEAGRFTPDENGDLRRSAIKQVASGRFGVNTHYLVNADELQIKVAQGAKPGEGGQLPGHKVDERIARVRCSTPGVTLISPPPHHDIYSIEDLAQLIYDLQTVNPKGRVAVKLVSEVGVGTVAAGVAKGRAGCVVIAGYEGGTGASPISSIQRAGLPWELGLAETQQVLVENGLRSRIRLQVDGGLRTSRDILIAALLGAEEFGMATASLISVGCIMLRKCHLNTCSVGIATQDERLRRRFTGTPEAVVRFFRMTVEELRRQMAALGARTLEELIGRVELLRQREPHPEWGDERGAAHWKAERLDLSALLHKPGVRQGTSDSRADGAVGDGPDRSPDEVPAARPDEGPDQAPGELGGHLHEQTDENRAGRTGAEPDPSLFCREGQRQPIAEDHLDTRILAQAEGVLDGRAATVSLRVRNVDRAVGTLLSGDIARRHGAAGLPEGTLTVKLTGTAGQSFGAFLVRGVALSLEGEANDYVGKGLSGGTLAIRPAPAARYLAEENVIVGNTCLYGATSGDAFLSGLAGERFAVRNSGARAVVEGVGDHGCEYMTGGVVVVLGETGRNFGAGMSGGVAFVLDEKDTLPALLNLGMVELETVEEEDDRSLLRGLVEEHVRMTQSPLAARLLERWEETLPRFKKVMPVEYKRVLAERRELDLETKRAAEGMREAG